MTSLSRRWEPWPALSFRHSFMSCVFGFSTYDFANLTSTEEEDCNQARDTWMSVTVAYSTMSGTKWKTTTVYRDTKNCVLIHFQ